MDRQKIFDKVRNRMLEQNGKSVMRSWPSPDNVGVFAYRATAFIEGATVWRKCAIGHLIKDEHYEYDMEGLPIDKLLRKYPHVARSLGVENDRDISLLVALQYTHDFVKVKHWDTVFAQTARCFNLEHPFPEKYLGEKNENDPGFRQSARPNSGRENRASVQATRREPALV
jgi:hypothetical protein